MGAGGLRQEVRGREAGGERAHARSDLPPLARLPTLQTFQDELLALCGRAHDAADVLRAVEAVHAAGVPSWSLDLMSGLPQACAIGLLCRDATIVVPRSDQTPANSWPSSAPGLLLICSDFPLPMPRVQLTEEAWGRSLEQAIDAGPHHVSTYDLQASGHWRGGRRDAWTGEDLPSLAAGPGSS